MSDLISRQAAIEALYHVDEYNWQSVKAIKSLPSAQPEPCKDVVIRNAIIQKLNTMDRYVSEELRLCDTDKKFPKNEVFIVDDVYEEIVENPPSAQPEPQWIPCSERLPEDIRPVIVTWKNNDPASYYKYIVGKHFTGTACYKNDKWYWYSSTCQDYLEEYGRCDVDEIDTDIEVIAWMPLPTPFEPQESEDKE